MKKRRDISCWLLLGLGILFCSRLAAGGDGSVMARIQAVDQPYNTLAIETVQQLPLKTVQAKESYQGGAFRVLARKDAILHFRCSRCHTAKAALVRDGAAFTHGAIEINHGQGENRLVCTDCHAKERDFLMDMQGRKIDFDHSYQLCGQCHFRPKRDWLGGAHGKRATYWAGERVVWNCTNCHSPHSPAFGTKMPETYSLPLDE